MHVAARMATSVSERIVQKRWQHASEGALTFAMYAEVRREAMSIWREGRRGDVLVALGKHQAQRTAAGLPCATVKAAASC